MSITIMGAWLLDVNGNWYEANGDIETRIIDFITRLQTIKGEQSFNANNGIDFLNIINGRALIQVDINNIAMDFLDYFYVKIEEVKRDLQKKVMSVGLRIILKDNTEIKYNLLLGDIINAINK